MILPQEGPLKAIPWPKSPGSEPRNGFFFIHTDILEILLDRQTSDRKSTSDQKITAEHGVGCSQETRPDVLKTLPVRDSKEDVLFLYPSSKLDSKQILGGSMLVFTPLLLQASRRPGEAEGDGLPGGARISSVLVHEHLGFTASG